MYENSYPRDLIDKCVKNFLEEILAPKPVVNTVPKKDLKIAQPSLDFHRYLRSGIVYNFQHGSSNATYYGKTKRHIKVRMCEHLDIFTFIGERVKGDNDSAIKGYLSFCNHTPDLEDFSILGTNTVDFKVTLIEKLLINIDHPPLNKNKQSLPLELFES